MKKETLKKDAKFFCIIPLFIAFSSSMALILIYASSREPLLSSAAALITWLSYSSIHELTVGVPIDDRQIEKKRPLKEINWLFFSAAALIFVAGTYLVVIGLNSATNYQVFLGTGTVLSGYFLGHYELRNSIV